MKECVSVTNRPISLASSKASTPILGLATECAFGVKRTGRETDQGAPPSANGKVTGTILTPAPFTS